MDTFQLIRQFFTRMSCRFCSASFSPDDIHLIGRGRNYFVVAIHCHDCGQHNGDAAVGVEQVSPSDVAAQMQAQLQAKLETMGAADEGMEISLEELLEAFGRRFAVEDPELTEDDIRRLEDLPPITDDDVLAAHEFFNDLDGGWMNKIPKQFRKNDTSTDELA